MATTPSPGPVSIAVRGLQHGFGEGEARKQALFDVDDFERYVGVQAEAAIRHLASMYAYDDGEDLAPGEHTLRGGLSGVSMALRDESQERFDAAGVEVLDAKISHLAYAPEIAQVMLRRQQAEAIISARAKIVHGAVTMVEAALKGLEATPGGRGLSRKEERFSNC